MLYALKYHNIGVLDINKSLPVVLFLMSSKTRKVMVAGSSAAPICSAHGYVTVT